MNLRLIKINQLSGSRASIYSVIEDGETMTLFEKFIEENKNSFKSELKDIFIRLTTIGKKTGAREHFFKLKEGSPGDGVCALYDQPDSKLRLYCIRYGTSLIITGGGGPKSKNIRALQEDEKLNRENQILKEISQLIKNKTQMQEIRFSPDYMEFEGDLTLKDESDE